MTEIDQVLLQDPAASAGLPFLSYRSIYVLPEQTCLSKEDNLSQREQVWWWVLELQGFIGSLPGVNRREAGLSEMTLKTKELF